MYEGERRARKAMKYLKRAVAAASTIGDSVGLLTSHVGLAAESACHATERLRGIHDAYVARTHVMARTAGSFDRIAEAFDRMASAADRIALETMAQSETFRLGVHAFDRMASAADRIAHEYGRAADIAERMADMTEHALKRNAPDVSDWPDADECDERRPPIPNCPDCPPPSTPDR